MECSPNLAVLSSLLQAQPTLKNPTSIYKKLSELEFLEFYYKDNHNGSLDNFTVDDTVKDLIEELFDENDHLISTIVVLNNTVYDLDEQIVKPAFSIIETESAVNYVADRLNKILDSQVNRKGVDGGYERINVNNFTYSDILQNKRNDIVVLLRQQIEKDIKEFETQLNSLDKNDDNYQSITNLKRYIDFNKRVLKNIIERDNNIDLFNLARVKLEFDKGVSIKTREEVLEIVNDIEANKLSKNFDDRKAFAIDTINYFSKQTKLELSKLKNIDTPVKSSIDYYTGHYINVDIDSVLNKLIYLVRNQTDLEGMIKQWQKHSHLYGWIPNFIAKIREDELFAQGVFTDFRKFLVNEETLIIGDSAKSKVNVIAANKLPYYKIADSIGDFIKASLYTKSFEVDKLSKDIEQLTKIPNLIDNIINNTKSLHQLKNQRIYGNVEGDRKKAKDTNLNSEELFDLFVSKLRDNKDIKALIADISNIAKNYNIQLTDEVILSYIYTTGGTAGIKTLLEKVTGLLNNIKNHIGKKGDFSSESSILELADIIFSNSSANVNLMYFNSNHDKIYQLQLPTITSDIEALFSSYKDEVKVTGSKPRLNLWYEDIKDFAWVKHSTWFGRNGKFITLYEDGTYRINKDNVDNFKVVILNQTFNDIHKQTTEYTDFTDVDWFLANFFAFRGTTNDRNTNKDVGRTYFPTQSDSSVPRVVQAPKTNTGNLFEHLFSSKFKKDLRRVNIDGRNLTVAQIKRLNEIGATNIETTIEFNEETTVKLAVSNPQYLYDINTGDSIVTIQRVGNTNKYKVNPKTEVIDTKLKTETIQALLDIAQQDIDVFTEARDLILNPDGTLVDGIDKLMLPDAAYFKIIERGSEAEGDLVSNLQSPLSGEDIKKSSSRYLRLYKDKKGFTGSVFKFSNFPELARLFDPTTLQVINPDTFNADVKMIVLDFVKSEFLRHYDLQKEGIDLAQTQLPGDITSIEMAKMVFDVFVNRLINNNEVTHLFLGEFSGVAAANKRAKSIFSGKQVSHRRSFSKTRTRNDIIKVAVCNDVVIDSKLQLVRTELVKEHLGRLIKDEAKINELTDKIVKVYNGITLSDGQSMVTLNFWIKDIKSKNLWYKYKELFDEQVSDNGKVTYKIKDKPDLKLLSDLFVPQKPFLKGANHRVVVGEKYIPMNQQLKTSTIVAIPEYISDPKLKALVLKMDELDIDILSFQSANKEQVRYINDIFDNNGDVIVDNLDTLWADEYMAHDYGTILEVPEEHLDKDTKVGIQFAKLIKRYINRTSTYTNLSNTKSMSGRELLKKLEQIESINIEEGFYEAFEDLGIIGRVENGKFELDELDLRKLVDYLVNANIAKNRTTAAEMLQIDPNTGKMLVPFIHPTNVKTNLSLFTSKFRSKVTDQKLLGAHFVLFSDMFQNMYANRTNKTIVEDSDKLGAYLDPETGALILECKISVVTKNMLFGNKVKSIDDIDEDLRYIAGYRIPSTGQESMIILKIVDILPPTIKSSIVVNHEIINRTGTDFDVDHLYIMMKGGYNTGIGIKSYKSLTLQDLRDFNDLTIKYDELVDSFFNSIYNETEGLDELKNGVAVYNSEILNILNEIKDKDMSVAEIEDWAEETELAIATIKAELKGINATINDNNKVRKELLKSPYISQLKELKFIQKILANQLSKYDSNDTSQYAKRIENVITKITKLNTSNANSASIYNLTTLANAVNNQEVRSKLLENINAIKEVNETISTRQLDQFDKLAYNVNAYGDTQDANEFNMEFQPRIIRDNEILDIYLSILSNENSFLTGVRAAEYSKLQSYVEEDSRKKLTTFSSPNTQDILRSRASEGKKILPLAASMGTLNAVFEQTQAISPIDVVFEIDKTETIEIEAINKAYGQSNVEDRAKSIIVTNNRLSWNDLSSMIVEGSNIADNTSEHTNNAADYVKFPMPHFINSVNEPLILILEQLQVPISVFNKFFKLDVVADYFNNITKNIITPSNKWTINDQIGKVIMSYINSNIESLKVEGIINEYNAQTIKNIQGAYKKYNNVNDKDLNTLLKIFKIEQVKSIDLLINDKFEGVDKLKQDIKILYSLDNLNRLQSLVSSYNKVLNVDKLSIAPDINNYFEVMQKRRYIYNSNERGEFVITSNVTGKELLDSIFEEDGISSTLNSYMKYGLVLPYQIVQKVFSHFDDTLAFQSSILDNTLTNMSSLTKRNTQQAFRLYSIYRKYAKHPFLDLNVLAPLNNYYGDKLFEYNPHSNTGINYTSYLLNQNINDGSTSVRFINLKDKLAYVQEIFRNNNISNNFIELLEPEINTKKKIISIRFRGENANEKVLKQNIKDLSISNPNLTLNDNLIVQSLLEDLIRYSFYNTGFNFSAKGFSHILPSELMVGLDFTTTVERATEAESSLYRIADMQNVIPAEQYINTKAVIDFLTDIKNISYVPLAPENIPFRDELVTVFPVANKLVEVPNYMVYKFEPRVKESPIVYLKRSITREDGTSGSVIDYYLKLGTWTGRNGKGSYYYYKIVTREDNILFNLNSDTTTDFNTIYAEALDNGFPTMEALVQSRKDNMPLAYPAFIFRNWLDTNSDTLSDESTENEDDFEFQRYSESDRIDEAEAKHLFDKLQRRFKAIGINAKLVIDYNLKSSGKINSDGTISINPRLVKADTIHHEFGHLVLDLIEDKDFVNTGIAQVDDELLNKLKVLYPNYSPERLKKEALVTTIGDLGAKYEKSSRLKLWLHYYYRKFSNALNKLTNGKIGKSLLVAEQIAMGLVNTKALPLLNLKLQIQENFQNIQEDLNLVRRLDVQQVSNFSADVFKQLKAIDGSINKTIKWYNIHKDDIFGQGELHFLQELKGNLGLDYMLSKLGLVQKGADVEIDPNAMLSPFEVHFARTNVSSMNEVTIPVPKEDSYTNSEGKVIKNIVYGYKKYSLGANTNNETIEITKVIEVITNLIKTGNSFLTSQYTLLSSLSDELEYINIQYSDFVQQENKRSKGEVITTEFSNPFETLQIGTIQQWSNQIAAITRLLDLYENLSFSELSQLDVEDNIKPVDLTELENAVKNRENDPATYEEVVRRHQEYLYKKLYSTISKAGAGIDKQTINKIKSIVSMAQKTISMWSVNKSSNESFKTELSRLTSLDTEIFDATTFQTWLLSAHASHDTVVANTAQMIRKIDIVSDMNYKSELATFKSLQESFDNAIKEYNKKHGTNIDDSIFYDVDGKIMKQYDYKLFFDNYKNRKSEPTMYRGQIVDIPQKFERFITEAGGSYDKEGAAKAYMHKKDQLKANIITQTEFDNWVNTHVFLKDMMDGTTKVYPKLEGDFIKLGGMYENKQYILFLKIAEEFPVVTEYFSYLSRVTIELVDGIGNNPQTTGLLPAIGKRRNIWKTLIEKVTPNDRINEAIKLELHREDSELDLLRYKYIGLYKQKATYNLPKQYTNESKEEYHLRALNYVNTVYGKSFKSYTEITDENYAILKDNLKYHNANVERRPSKFIPIFIKELFELKAKQQYETTLLLLQEHIKNRKYLENNKVSNNLLSINELGDTVIDKKIGKVKSGETNLDKQLQGLMDRQFYNKNTTNSGRLKYLKLVDKYGVRKARMMAAFMFLGLNWMSAIRDASIGLGRRLSGGIKGTHYTSSDLIKNIPKDMATYYQKLIHKVDNVSLKYLNTNILPKHIAEKYNEKNYILSIFTNYVDYTSHLENRDTSEKLSDLIFKAAFLPQSMSSYIQETNLVTLLTNINALIDGKLLSKVEYVNNHLRGLNPNNINFKIQELVERLNNLKASELDVTADVKSLTDATTIKDQLKAIKKVAKFIYKSDSIPFFEAFSLKNNKLRLNIDANLFELSREDYYKKMNTFSTVEAVYFRIEHTIEKMLEAGIPFNDLFEKVDGSNTIKDILLNEIGEDLDKLAMLPEYKGLSKFRLLKQVMNYNSTTNSIEPGFILSIDNKLLDLATTFKAKLNSISHAAQGVYNMEDKPMAVNTETGTTVMAMFQWAPSLIDQVIGGRTDYTRTFKTEDGWSPAYNEAASEQRTASMTNIHMKYIVTPMLEIPLFLSVGLFYKSLKLIPNYKKEIPYFEQSLKTKLGRLMEEYRWSSPETKGVLREVIFRDIVLLALCYALRLGLDKLFDDDDDDDNDEFFSIVYYIGRSVAIEWSGWVAPFTVNSIYAKYQDPAAALSLMGDYLSTIMMLLDEDKPLSTRENVIWGDDIYTNKQKALLKLNPLRIFEIRQAQYKKITGTYSDYKKTKAEPGLELDGRIGMKPIYDFMFGNPKIQTEKEKNKAEKSKIKQMNEAKNLDNFMKLHGDGNGDTN